MTPAAICPINQKRQYPKKIRSMPICQYCHRSIEEDVHPYTLKMELYPAVEPSLQINEKDLQIDLEEELRRLVEMMEQMGEGEIVEQEKLIYFKRTFTLCPRCRHKLVEELDRLSP